MRMGGPRRAPEPGPTQRPMRWVSGVLSRDVSLTTQLYLLLRLRIRKTVLPSSPPPTPTSPPLRPPVYREKLLYYSSPVLTL
jgi:hypothetical protein